MFEVGWTEMLVIAIVAIVVVGPKDLPQMLRQVGRTTAKLRAMAGDFRKQFDEALKEAELDDVKQSINEIRGLNPATQVRKQLNPFTQAAQDVRSGIENAMKPKPPIASQPASPEAHPAEPLKNGATESILAATPEPAPIAAPPPEGEAKPAEVAANGSAFPPAADDATTKSAEARQ